MSILSDLAVKMATRQAEEAAAKRAAMRAVEEQIAPRMAVKALPAPPKRLALPAPKPKPDPQFKPRGGQWFPNAKLGETDPVKAGWSLKDRGASYPPNSRYIVTSPRDGPSPGYSSPEAALDYASRQQMLHGTKDYSPEAAVLRNAFEVPTDEHAAWLQKALLKYYKNDFGTEADPLRDLAARGLHYAPEMTPDKWTRMANDSIMEDPIGYYTTPPHWSQPLDGNTGYDTVVGPQVAQAAPWLAKQPVTDSIYGISSPLDLGHFNDELHNALRPDASGLPADLAVRPESLQRMSFPQAVEHVGRINQFRVKQMEDAAQAALNNPAIHTHKDYGDGMRWVELKQPEGMVADEGGNYPEDLYGHLQDALRHEGDTMGHCVGGYCSDVIQGRSRIFSLRDAKGQPHVTVETSPKSMVYSDLVKHLGGDTSAADDYLVKGYQTAETDTSNKSALAHAMDQAGVPRTHDIVQIKGKQNRAPNDQYLPYVQDFVKSGQWGNVGDFGNTGLVKLPDGRYITKQQHAEAIASPAALELFKGDAEHAAKQLAPWNINTFSDDDWATTGHVFQGYAYGGRVTANRDFAGRV